MEPACFVPSCVTVWPVGQTDPTVHPQVHPGKLTAKQTFVQCTSGSFCSLTFKMGKSVLALILRTEMKNYVSTLCKPCRMNRGGGRVKLSQKYPSGLLPPSRAHGGEGTWAWGVVCEACRPGDVANPGQACPAPAHLSSRRTHRSLNCRGRCCLFCLLCHFFCRPNSSSWLRLSGSRRCGDRAGSSSSGGTVGVTEGAGGTAAAGVAGAGLAEVPSGGGAGLRVAGLQRGKSA